MKDLKWHKHGKIFDPTHYEFAWGRGQFAQSPQVLVFEDFVRIYFSTRQVDHNGKFLSHIAFVDMQKNLKTVIGVSTKPVIALGELGCFDEHGIFPMSVFCHGGTTYGYTCGWSRRVAVSVETGIGLAISHDQGLTFERLFTGPVLSASLHEPFLVGDGFVRFFNEKFHMWYIFGTGWKSFQTGLPPDRTYKIGHAISDDGVNWVKDDAVQIIPNVLGEDESQALPCVIQHSGRYYMFFCYRHSFDFRQTKGRGYRIGCAWSEDLVHWVRNDDDVFPGGDAAHWDSDMQCYPHVFLLDGKIYMLYNGNEFGKYGFGLAELS